MFRRKLSTPTLPPTAMVVGLGNPGAQYAGTRHNVGFDVVERLARAHGIALKTHRHQAQFGQGTVAGVSVVLAKPLTFMNLSGRAVVPLARQFGLGPEQILVVADDLDLDLGRIRVRAEGSSGGHNGHKSLIQSLGTDKYPRLKIGIGRPDDATVDHVLSKFRPDERVTADEALARCVEACESWLVDGTEATMNRFNVR